MTDEAELLQRLRNREKNSIDEAIRAVVFINLE